MDPTIVVRARIPASADRIYEAFLDAEEHGAMTGASATSEPRVGGRFTAWDGYIEGRYLELVPGVRIVAAWRTSEFPEKSADSRVEIGFERDGDATLVTLVHSEIPDGQSDDYAKGWDEYYFVPMRAYFAAS